MAPAPAAAPQSRSRVGATPRTKAARSATAAAVQQEPLIADTPPPPADLRELVAPGTVFDGSEVVAGERELSNLSARFGKPIYTGRLVLTLADGRTVYGCAECTVIAADRASIISHRRDCHVDGRQKPGPPKGSSYVSADVQAMAVGEALALLASASEWGQVFDTITADRNQWRDRALRAESSLRQTRSELEREKASVQAQSERSAAAARKQFAKAAAALGLQVVAE